MVNVEMVNVKLVVGKEIITLPYLSASGDILGGTETYQEGDRRIEGPTLPKAAKTDVEPPPFLHFGVLPED